MVSRTKDPLGSTIDNAGVLTCANASLPTLRVDAVTKDIQDSNHYVGKAIWPISYEAV
jgi:hypothetical protein